MGVGSQEILLPSQPFSPPNTNTLLSSTTLKKIFFKLILFKKLHGLGVVGMPVGAAHFPSGHRSVSLVRRSGVRQAQGLWGGTAANGQPSPCMGKGPFSWGSHHMCAHALQSYPRYWSSELCVGGTGVHELHRGLRIPSVQSQLERGVHGRTAWLSSSLSLSPTSPGLGTAPIANVQDAREITAHGDPMKLRHGRRQSHWRDLNVGTRGAHEITRNFFLKILLIYLRER